MEESALSRGIANESYWSAPDNRSCCPSRTLGAKQDVNGSEISWDLTFERERGKFIITYSGRIQEKGMKGKVTYGTLGSGKWTATAQ